MSQESESDLQRPEPDPFELVDIPRNNPWWADESHLPPKSLPRTDLYWRVRNTLENDLLIIPGAPVTGTKTTLAQLIRALLLGSDYEDERIQELFVADETLIGPDGCDPEQVCLASCRDPLAHLVDNFVDEVRKSYHERAATTPNLDYFLILEDVHRLDDWREQLLQTHRKLNDIVPHENWTIVATVPIARLARESAVPDHDKMRIDRPHHTQKFRDTLVTAEPALQTKIRPIDEEQTPLARARTALREAARGEASRTQLTDAFTEIETLVRNDCGENLDTVIDRYLTIGGFDPVISTPKDGDWLSTQSVDDLTGHIENGLATTLYQEIQQLAKIESDIPRIQNPEELHAVVAFLARRSFGETSYRGLGDFLNCDTRTIRQKYIPLLEDLHIGERATRYDLERNRTLRFYLRSPGYVTALTGSAVSETDREDRLRMTLSDHLRRLLAKYDSQGGLQYWVDDDHLVDYVFDIDGQPVLFISEFADEPASTPEAFDAFANEVKAQNLEVVVTGSESEVAVEDIENRLRLSLPHWLLLAIC